MGDIADGLLDGTFDSETGEYLGEGPGYPRTRNKRSKVHYYEKAKRKPGPQGGAHLIGKWADVALKHPDGKHFKERLQIKETYKGSTSIRYIVESSIGTRKAKYTQLSNISGTE